MDDELVQARAIIRQQRREIERLRQQVSDVGFVDELRRALTVAAATETIAAPITHLRLLEMIVETAAYVISARAAALFLLDEAAGELVFQVALGQKADEAKKFRVPLGHGIAGLVAVSGQPIAVSDAQSDPRQAADIAQSIGYIPQNLLCVPLFYDGHVIGVLELLDKVGAPSFGATDMDALGLFANQAAVAIVQSRLYQNLAALVGEVLTSLLPAHIEASWTLTQTQAFAAKLEESVTFQEALDVARLVHEIALYGEDELTTCRGLVKEFAAYLRARSELTGELIMAP